ncbi:MAG TPA: hypothetical protein VKA30_10515 [Actinomycetota bacterium]|nr:hypothetical protein [Actinomycetota bacterium]
MSAPAPSSEPVQADAPDPLRPFRRVGVPKEHLPPREISGRGYDCGCRAATDYDGKIGEEIGADLANVLKTLTGLKAIDAAKDALTTFLGGIPFIGPAIKTGIQKFFDDIDPLKNLMKRLGKALDALLVDSLIRGVPSWVPAYRGPTQEQKQLEQERLEQEVEGRLVRSRQRYDSVPFTQWHAWYDWSFRISPVAGFEPLVGAGNRNREKNDPSLDQPEAVGKTRYDHDTSAGPGNFNATVDCEWDLGAFGEKPGAFLTQQGSDTPIDWMWPMTGAHFWAAGRCVYDCSHATSDTKEGNDPGLHLNQLHPCKAIATARHEAVKFDENPLAVPAIQFMFFASRSQARIHDDRDFTRDHPINTAGDFRFDAINDVDYSFIVDLPPAPARDGPYHVGATPATLLNTLVAGRPLLHRFEVQNFMTTFGFSSNGGVTPDIEPIRPKNGGFPTQVKVTIPLTRLSADIETYGVIVSLGWFDPAGALARVVHKVTIELGQIVLMKRDETRAEYRVNVAVNGRWFFFGADSDDEVEDNRSITLNRDTPQPLTPGSKRRKPSGPPRTLTLFLAEDDAVSISVHGMEQDGLGDIMDMAPDHRHPTPPSEALLAALKVLEEGYLDDRLLRLPKLVKVTQPGSGEPPKEFQVPFIGDPVVWKTDVDDRDITPGADNKKRDEHASLVARAMFLRLAMQAFDANDLMGLIDPNVRFPDAPSETRRKHDSTDAPNPFKISRIIKEVGFGVFRSCELTGYQTDAFGRMGNLAYDPEEPEYLIRYRVKVERQEPAPPASPPPR